MNVRGVVLSIGLFAAAGAIFAQAPAPNIDPKKHANLSAAQDYIRMAYQKIEAAQKINKEGMGGHGDKAEQLLDEANRELKAGAEYADAHLK